MPRKPTDQDRPRRPFQERDRASPRTPHAKSSGGGSFRRDRDDGDAPKRKPRFDKPTFRDGKPGRKPDRKPDRKPRAETSLPRPPREDMPMPEHRERERVAKVIARAGLASRREIEEWIFDRRVAVNGTVLESPAMTVGPEDRITVDGQPLPEKERTRLFLFHKPRGLVTTTDDPEGRPTVFDVLPADLPRLVSVGRLDVNTEGLLLLTNDGGLARVLELPETGWLRRYRVRAFGDITQPQLDALRDGIEIDGFRYGAIEATLDREQGSNVWMTVALREGKKREIRTVLGHLNVQVNRLIRVSYGPFQLGELAEGAVEEMRSRVLRDQLGERIVALAGSDFDAPIRVVEAPKDERRPPRERPQAERGPRADRPQRRDRDAREGREPRETRDRPSKPPMPPRDRRPRSVWRAAPEGDAVLKKKLTRRERQAPAPADDPRPKSAGLVADRKGRRILVERIAPTPAPEPAPRPERDRAPERKREWRSEKPPRGERPFRSRDDAPRSGPPRGEKRSFDKGRSGDRPFGKRDFEKRDFDKRPDSDRPRGLRPQGGKGGPRPHGSKGGPRRPPRGS